VTKLHWEPVDNASYLAIPPNKSQEFTTDMTYSHAPNYRGVIRSSYHLAIRGVVAIETYPTPGNPIVVTLYNHRDTTHTIRVGDEIALLVYEYCPEPDFT